MEGMNKAEREASYAKNCTIQRQIISLADSIMEEAVAESLENTVPTSMGIADLGCSSGPNTFLAISQTINSVSHACCAAVPELRISLNDLPSNDFNQVFTYLPEFYTNLTKVKGIGSDRCFVSAMPGSFYGRLYPSKSLHFVHSSSSLHWLSKVPLASGNEGKIYISKTSSAKVVKAYQSQFEKDLWVFLRSRAEEVVAGGTMVLSFMGRTSADAGAEVGTHQWELLAEALMSIAQENQVVEEKMKTFNVPYYAASPEEVRNVIEEEGSFTINHLESFEIGWDGGAVDDKHSREAYSNIGCKSKQVAKTIRAVVEPWWSRILELKLWMSCFVDMHFFFTVISPKPSPNTSISSFLSLGNLKPFIIALFLLFFYHTF